MRYPTSEKLKIIKLVEGSYLPAKQTLDKLGVPRRTFYRWYDPYLTDGEDGLVDRASHPGRVWNKIAETVRSDLLDLALEYPELSHVSWRSGSQIRRATLSLRAQYTGF